MENIDFLKQVLMSTDEYWLVAKKAYSRQYSETKRVNDQILFIVIPQGIKRGLKYEEITLKELKKLHESCCDLNIYLSEDYPPFQTGQDFYNIYKGYPIDKNIKQFAIDALKIVSSDIFDYKELIKE